MQKLELNSITLFILGILAAMIGFGILINAICGVGANPWNSMGIIAISAIVGCFGAIFAVLNPP